MMERKELPAVEAALDRAIADCLRPPVLPQDFRIRLRQAVDRHDAAELERRRAALELEFRRNLARLQSAFVRRRTVAAGSLVLASVGIGAALAALMPYVNQLSTAAITPVGRAAGVAIGLGLAAAVCLAQIGSMRRLL